MPPPHNPPNWDISAELMRCEDGITKLSEKTGEFKGLKAMHDKFAPLWEDKYKHDKETVREMDATLKTTQQEVKDLKRHIASLQEKARGSGGRMDELEELISTRKVAYEEAKKDHDKLVFTKVYFSETGKGSDREMRDLEAKMKDREAKMKRCKAKLQESESELKELKEAPNRLTESRNKLKDAEERAEHQDKEVKHLKEKIDRDWKRREEVKSLLATDQDRQQNSMRLKDEKSRLLELQKELRMQDDKTLWNKVMALDLELRRVRESQGTLTSELKRICANLTRFREMQIHNRDKGWGKLVDTHKELIKLSKS